MTKALFDSHIIPSCRYCTYGMASSDEQTILCPKKGVVTCEYACRRFQYDPLKRKPAKTDSAKLSKKKILSFNL